MISLTHFFFVNSVVVSILPCSHLPTRLRALFWGLSRSHTALLSPPQWLCPQLTMEPSSRIAENAEPVAKISTTSCKSS